MKHLYMIIILALPAALFSAAGGDIPNSYNGTAITAETLYAITPPLPDAALTALNSQLAKPEMRSLLTKLLAFDSFPAWRDKMVADNAALSEAGMPNESKWNYVFKLTDTDFVVKIAGPLNRLQSVLMAHGFWPGEKPTRPISKVDTYQTASRAAYYLILKQLIEEQHFQHINVPETYLVHFPECAKTVDDEHVFILQKAIPASAQKQKLTSERAQTLSDEAIRELVQAVIGGGLWNNMEDNLFLDTESNKDHPIIRLVDLEQPNNSAPADFFHKDPVRYYGNLRFGIEELLKLFVGNPEKLALIRALVETNPIFNSPNFSPRYKNELIGVLNAQAPYVLPPTVQIDSLSTN
jgi:hypothetical protein